MLFPLTPVLDNFTGANGVALNSSLWGLDPYAVSYTTPHYNASNQCALNTSEAAYWLGQFAQNQECFATWVSGNHSLHVRITPGTGNAYAIRTAAGNLDLYRNDGSAVTVLTSTPITFTSGDKWGIRAVGSTITAWYAPAGVFPSTPTLTWTDGTYIKPGAIAILCSGTTGSNSVLDDFGGGNVYTKNYPQYFVDGTISTFGLNTVDRVK